MIDKTLRVLPDATGSLALAVDMIDMIDMIDKTLRAVIPIMSIL